MFTTIKRKYFLLYFVIFFLAFFIGVQYTDAGFALDDTGLVDTAGEAFDSDIPLKDASPASIIGKIVGALLSFVGVIFFILMIYGGFLWMTAAGNEQQVGKAKSLIIAAIVGLIIIASAYAITSLIGSSITSP